MAPRTARSRATCPDTNFASAANHRWPESFQFLDDRLAMSFLRGTDQSHGVLDVLGHASHAPCRVRLGRRGTPS